MNLKKLIENFQLFCFSMFVIIWYINESRQTGKKYAILFLIIFSAIEGLKIIKKGKIVLCKPMIAYVLFTVFCFISSIWAINPVYSISKSGRIAFGSVFLFLGFNYFLNTENGTKKLLYIIMFSGIVFAFYILKYYGIGLYFRLLLKGRRVGSDIANVNAIGLKTATSFIICIFLGLANKKKIYYLLSILPFIVSLGTGSKKILIMIVLGFFLLLNNEKGYIKNYKQLIKFIITIVLILGIAILIMKLQYFETIFNRTKVMWNSFRNADYDSNSSTGLRKAFIEKGFKSFLEHPFTGIGIGNTSYITKEVRADYLGYLHNNYIELLASVGLIGFLLYYYNYYYIIKLYLKNRKEKKTYINLVTILVVINLVVEVGYVSFSTIGVCLLLLFEYIIVHDNLQNGERNE